VSSSPAHARPRPLPAVTGRIKILIAALCAVALLGSGASVVTRTADASQRPTAAVMAHPPLKYASRGTAVKWLQIKLGVKPRSAYFGPRTRKAVVRFQKRHGLRATGVVNHRTWTKLGVRYRPAKASRSTSRTAVPGTVAFGNRVVRVAASTAKGAYYRYGGTGPRGFDCSGYVGYVYRKATGKKLPRTSGAMRSKTRRLSARQARPGDLFFVHSSSGRVTHVGILGGNRVWWEATNPRSGVGANKPWSSRVSYGRV
jgi:cell wall-associated NlpC family hydrolase